ncbi:hypothetical protein [Kibdelosporangium aridum]|uniref:hypothetical protein n=1 Tax=Kibdelosporangium aridum TaxID=2030 RepID=UPI000AA6F49C|nr:hypothetical protein [Kibdelosporangium aridum]
MLNLFIAVAVSAMEAQISKEREQQHADDMATVLAELRALRAAVDRLEQPIRQ